MSKVSVVTSVYNGKKYLIEAIDSILNQTFEDFEFIIINDGSTDNTQYLIDRYEDKRIIKLRNDVRLGIPEARNKAMKKAAGEYIAVMDADDISLHKRLELQVKFLDEHSHIGLLGSSYFVIDEDGKVIESIKVPFSNEEIQRELIQGNFFAHGSIIFRKECLDKVGMYRKEFKYAHDYDLILRISEHFQTANLPEVLYKRRINPKGVSIVKRNSQRKECIIIKQLANERRQYKKEKLEVINTDKIYFTSWIENRRVLFQTYYSWGKYLYNRNAYKSALRFFIKLFPCCLFNIDIAFLILKTVLKSIASKKTISRFLKKK